MPLLLIMALTKEPWSRFGIRRPDWMIDLFGGVTIGGLAIFAEKFTYSFLPLSLLEWSPSHGNHHEVRPEGIAISLLILLAIIADAFAEELAMRAYLIPRLETLLRSKAFAVLISTLLFASYHLYQGVFAAIGRRSNRVRLRDCFLLLAKALAVGYRPYLRQFARLFRKVKTSNAECFIIARSKYKGPAGK